MSDDSVNWPEIETRENAVRNVESDDIPLDLQGYKARVKGLTLSEKIEPVQMVRTLISRGNTAAVKDTVKRLLAKDKKLEKNPEWRLEMARIAVLGGNWKLGFTETKAVLNLQPTTMTRMTALQSSSLCHYELGDFASAKQDIEYIRSLGQIYPKAQAHFFNEVLHLKILACEGLVEKAEHELQQMWTRMLENRQLNLNVALTLLRAEAHVLRCAGKSPLQAIFACHLLSERLGDELYAGLARLELFLAGDPSEKLAKAIGEDRKSLAKVDLLLNEIESRKVTSTTAKNLSHKVEMTASTFDQPSAVIEAVVIPSRQILLRLQPFSAVTFETASQPAEMVLTVLSQPKPTKRSVFEAVFKQRYVPHMHDRLLHVTLSRARSKWSFYLEVAPQGIEKPKVFVV